MEVHEKVGEEGSALPVEEDPRQRRRIDVPAREDHAHTLEKPYSAGVSCSTMRPVQPHPTDSSGRTSYLVASLEVGYGGRRRIRTSDPLLVRQVLYTAELCAHEGYLTEPAPACRPFKTAQMRGARRVDSEAYDLYAAGRHEERNDADEPFSTPCLLLLDDPDRQQHAVTEDEEDRGDRLAPGREQEVPDRDRHRRGAHPDRVRARERKGGTRGCGRLCFLGRHGSRNVEAPRGRVNAGTGASV